MRGLFVGQFARRSNSGRAGFTRGHYNHQRFCEYRSGREPEDESTPVHAASRPEDIHIVKAGGNSGIYSELIMNYFGVFATTVRIPDAPGMR